MSDKDNDESALTPERMQEQCATIADALESHLDHAVSVAREKAAKTPWYLFWQRRHHLDFAHAAMFASAVAKTAALVIRAMPNDHPVEVSLAGLSIKGSSSDGSEEMPKVSTKPKGVTLQ